MTHDEFVLVIDDAKRQFWPTWKPPDEKVGWVASQLRFANKGEIWTMISSYAHENPDDERPKALWSRLLSGAFERGLTDRDDRPDEFDMTKGQRDAIVKELRTKASMANIAMSSDDEEVYLDWCRRTYPAMFGAPFYGSLDWVLVMPDRVVEAIYAAGGERAERIRVRRDWWLNGGRTAHRQIGTQEDRDNAAIDASTRMERVETMSTKLFQGM